VVIRAGTREDAEAAGHAHVDSWAAAYTLKGPSAGWVADGERRTIEFVGESIPEVRYAKQL
jgi:hypothetical protein